MITLGVVYGGPELRDSMIHDVLSAVGKAAIEACGDFEFGSIYAVNAVFYVPGSLDAPDWDDMREGRFSRKEKMLMVQVAVPEEMVSSDKALDFVIEALHGANCIAFHYLDDKGLDYDLRKAESLVKTIAELANDML